MNWKTTLSVFSALLLIGAAVYFTSFYIPKDLCVYEKWNEYLISQGEEPLEPYTKELGRINVSKRRIMVDEYTRTDIFSKSELSELNIETRVVLDLCGVKY